jgi:hypothetical protein
MTLDEAFHLLSHIYTQSQKRDLHADAGVIEAFRIVTAAHPEVRGDLIEYWRAMTLDDALDAHWKQIRTSECHPLMRGLFRRCKRPGY